MLAGDDLPAWWFRQPENWRAYMQQKILATPPWADASAINRRYDEARECTRMCGTPYSVDHIVPLRHPRVCGLHVSWNLRVVQVFENAQKGNYFCPEQMDMFYDPAQFALWT